MRIPESFKPVKHVRVFATDNGNTLTANVIDAVDFININLFYRAIPKEYDTVKCWELLGYGALTLYVVFVDENDIPKAMR